MSVLAVVVSGLLFGLAFPPWSLRLLAWAAFVPALIAVRRAGTAGAVGLAALFATACTCATVHWLPHTVATYYDQPWIVGFGLFAGITLLMVVPPWVFFAVAYRALAARVDRGLAPLAAAAWVAGELGRANLWTGNPWVLLGYTQVDAPRLAQVAAVTGVYGLSFMVAWVNVALAELLLARDRPERRRRAARSLAIACAVLAAAWVHGHACLGALAAETPGAPMAVAVVQVPVDLATRWQPGREVDGLNAHLRLTHELLRERPPALVVWPELAMTFYVAREWSYRAALGPVMGGSATPLLTGGLHLVDAEGAERYLNSAFLLTPQGEIRGRYDKGHLLPFMEYFPFPQVDLLRRRFARARADAGKRGPAPADARRAGGGRHLQRGAVRRLRPRPRARRRHLALLTNDSWLSDATFSGIAADMARLRAIETGRSLVRASTWGPSEVVDAAGRVQATTPLAAAAVIRGDVEPRRALTPYVRLGDAFAFLCVAAVGAALVGRRPRA